MNIKKYAQANRSGLQKDEGEGTILPTEQPRFDLCLNLVASVEVLVGGIGPEHPWNPQEHSVT